LITFNKLAVFFLIISLNFGFSFKDNEPVSLLDSYKGKLKVKVNFTDSPHQKDFFNTELDKYLKLGLPDGLRGVWKGTYELKHDSIYWTNSHIENAKLFKVINFGPYNISIKIDFNKNGSLTDFDIGQEDIRYRSVNIEMANDKQINYWAKANSKNWLEIIKGKILRISDNELFTEFQTTVYENKIPIYAFNGSSVLQRLP